MEHEVPHYDDLMSNEVCREELEHCKARHPKLNDALVRLQATLQQALCRELQVTPDKRALQIAVFGLAHQAADDFYDVVLLGTHGYGIGAQKLIRPLYERVVSGVAKVLKNRPREEVATKAQVLGRIDNPKVGTVAAVVRLVQNALFKAILPGFDLEVSRSGREESRAEK